MHKVRKLCFPKGNSSTFIYATLSLSIHGLIGHLGRSHILSSANNAALYTAEQLLDFKIRQTKNIKSGLGMGVLGMDNS